MKYLAAKATEQKKEKFNYFTLITGVYMKTKTFL